VDERASEAKARELETRSDELEREMRKLEDEMRPFEASMRAMEPEMEKLGREMRSLPSRWWSGRRRRAASWPTCSRAASRRAGPAGAVTGPGGRGAFRAPAAAGGGGDEPGHHLVAVLVGHHAVGRAGDDVQRHVASPRRAERGEAHVHGLVGFSEHEAYRNDVRRSCHRAASCSGTSVELPTRRRARSAAAAAPRRRARAARRPPEAP